MIKEIHKLFIHLFNARPSVQHPLKIMFKPKFSTPNSTEKHPFLPNVFAYVLIIFSCEFFKYEEFCSFSVLVHWLCKENPERKEWRDVR